MKICNVIYSESLKKRGENGRDPVFGERMDEHILKLKKIMSPLTEKAQHISSKINKNKFISRYITEKLKKMKAKKSLKTRDTRVSITAVLFLRSKRAALHWQQAHQ